MSRIVLQGNKVRYAVLGAGWISQGEFMPALAKAPNSQLTVVITSDLEKAVKLTDKYKLLKAYSYEKFGEALAEGLFDAVYIATPNWMHKQFAVQALEAGCHVLLEKPMEVTEEDAHAINAAQRKSGAKLMIAYRLHCEQGTVEIINRVRSGDIGDPRVFSSVFTQPLKASNHRAHHGFEAGPVSDLGVYQINAARNLFGMEPLEVSAVGFKTPSLDFECQDTVSVTMRFPGERIATFTSSFGHSVAANRYSILGTKGEIDVSPAFTWGTPISYRCTLEDGKEHTRSFKSTDHFAAEVIYFSECVILGHDPEPNGDEGWRDVRVLCAIKRSLESGKAEQLEPLESRIHHPTQGMVRAPSIAKRPTEEEYVHCETPVE